MSLGTRLSLRARVVRHQAHSQQDNPPKLGALHRPRLDRLLASRDGPRVRRLLDFLSRMTLHDGAALIAHVKLDGWPNAERETRQDVLTIINNRIVHLRERAGLAPLDDPLPGMGTNVFLKLRELLADH
jgi:hypothetical protein